jgi:hypothetical protein
VRERMVGVGVHVSRGECRCSRHCRLHRSNSIGPLWVGSGHCRLHRSAPYVYALFKGRPQVLLLTRVLPSTPSATAPHLFAFTMKVVRSWVSLIVFLFCALAGCAQNIPSTWKVSGALSLVRLHLTKAGVSLGPRVQQFEGRTGCSCTAGRQSKYHASQHLIVAGIRCCVFGLLGGCPIA